MHECNNSSLRCMRKYHYAILVHCLEFPRFSTYKISITLFDNYNMSWKEESLLSTCKGKKSFDSLSVICFIFELPMENVM